MCIFTETRARVSSKSTDQRRRAFTLVELLVAMVVLIILIIAMVGMTNQANKIWRTSRDRITAFQGARDAFERMTFNLNQATLNTYVDYYKGKLSRNDYAAQYGTNSIYVISFTPDSYDRASELQFVCGSSTGGNNPLIKAPSVPDTYRPTHSIFFQCPNGQVIDPTVAGNPYKNLNQTLNAVGYYIEFTNENDPDPHKGLVPAFFKNPAPPASWRYRLMELSQPSGRLSVYSNTTGSPFTGASSWFQLAVNPSAASSYPPVYSIADNIVALIIRPKVANPTNANPTPMEIAPNYAYDTKGYQQAAADPTTSKVSKNQLPPMVQVTLVAIDGDSATRLAARNGVNPPKLVDTSWFTDTNKYDADLNPTADPNDQNSLVYRLSTTLHLNYRIFTTDVSIPGAKWSQTN